MFSLNEWVGGPSPSPETEPADNERRPDHSTSTYHDYRYPDIEAGGDGNSSDGGSGSSTPPLCAESLDSSSRSSCQSSSQCSSASTLAHEVLWFRPLQESDREEIQKLHEDWFPVRYKDEFFDNVVNNKMTGSEDPLYSCVAVVPDVTGGGRIVGCIVGSFVEVARCKSKSVELIVPTPQRHSRMFYIMTLGTVKEYRGRGLASRLVEECMRMIESDPECGTLYLHVITYNIAAISFYEKLGFSRVEEIEDYYLIDSKKYNCYLYAKYFHGNRGHFTMYTIVSNLISAVWRRISSPVYSVLFDEV